MDTLRILVSGTTNDLLRERDAIVRAVSALRIQSTRAEIEYSDEGAPREDILQRVYACGIYVGVFDRARYGRILPTDNVSIAELEFNHAQELKKPTLIFLNKVKAIEIASPRQEEFVGRVVALSSDKFSVFEYDTPDELEHLLAGVLQELLSARFYLQVTRPPFQAPRLLETFLGREDALKQVTSALAPGKPVVIHGFSDAGGLGKTELAICLAHQLRDTFADGILWANIPTARPAELLTAWARTYGGHGVLGRSHLRFVFGQLSLEARRQAEVNARGDALREQLRGKRVLAILDGMVDERDDEKIAPLLRALRECVVVVTSRTPRLPSLEQITPISLPRMTEEEAWELFARIAGRDRIGEARADLARVSRAVDHLPLALNLIARQLREHETWTPSACAQMVEDERGRLETTRWGYAAARGAQTALNVGYQFLSEPERNFFTRLGAFAGEDFDANATQYVADVTHAEASPMLERLLRLSLLQERRRRGRYALHPVVRLYAHAKLDSAEADSRMANYYCMLAKEQGKKLNGADVHEALAQLDAELSNIFAGHTWAQSWNNRAGWALCRDYVYGAMAYYFNLKSMWSDWISWSTLGIAACQKLGDDHGASSIAGSLGMVYFHQKELDQAGEFYRQALAIMEKLGHLAGIATIYMNLGNLQTEKSEWKEAIESHTKALQIRERLGDMRGLAQSRANLGLLYAKYGDKPKARAQWIQALEMFDHIGADREADTVRKWMKGLLPPTYR